MKKILIINGNPDKESFCHAMGHSYKKSSTDAGNEVREIILADIDFSLNLQHGFRKRTDWEPDLQKAWEALQWAEHIVWIYPIWWGVPPALLKGFIDRVFLPGFAFEYQDKSPFPKKLLKGKTAEIMITMDTPVFYYKLVYKNIGVRVIKKNVDGFCGIKHTRTTYITPLKTSTPEKRKEWLTKIEQIAAKV